MACGKFCNRCANSRNVASAGRREIFAAGDGGKLQQGQRGDGIAGRFGAVVIVLHAQNQVLRPGGALPETAIGRVVKFHNHCLSERDGEIKRLRFQRGFIKVNDPGEQERVGFKQLHVVARAIAPAMKQRSGFFVPQFFPDETPDFSPPPPDISFPQARHKRAPSRPTSDRSRRRGFCHRAADGCAGGAPPAFSLSRRSSRRFSASVKFGSARGSAHFAPATGADGCGQRSFRSSVMPKYADRHVEFLRRSTAQKAQLSSSSKISPHGLRCRRPRRNRSRRRDVSCRAKHNQECRARCRRRRVSAPDVETRCASR